MESQVHIELVNKVLNYTRSLIPEDTYQFIQKDSSGTNCTIRVAGNFVPDVYYLYNEILIIGEAKTVDDFNRPHSKKQFEGYIRECIFHDGEAVLIIGVPWQLVSTAKNYFRNEKKKLDLKFNIVIINELGRGYKI